MFRTMTIGLHRPRSDLGPLQLLRSLTMVSGCTFPTIIRNARDDEYETLGRIHAAATGADPLIKLICSQVDPDVLLQWNWIDGAKASVASGDATVLVLERADTKEVIGLASHTVFSPAKPPGYPTSLPEGYNIAVDEETEKPAIAWARGLIETYGQVLCKCPICAATSSDMINCT
jgi:hypothetical protein